MASDHLDTTIGHFGRCAQMAAHSSFARIRPTCEAKRIDLAFLFDPMMALHTSNVEPLGVAPSTLHSFIQSRRLEHKKRQRA